MKDQKNKPRSLSRIIGTFLRKNCKPLMVWYYMEFNQDDLHKMLKIFYEYKDIKEGIDIMVVIPIIKLEHGWDSEKAVKVFGKCVYCGLLSN